ncbi:MAG: family 43 glycosylhydrolase [Cytophagaceae bacterium]
MRACIIIVFIFWSLLSKAQVANPRTLPQEWSNYGIGDPYILKYAGKFYLYCSTRDDQIGVKVWSTWDYINWTYEGLCATDPITKGAYAPEVIYYNGVFYMYTSPAGNGHFILTSDSPTGPFVVRTGNLGHSIDGSVFVDDDARCYFTHAGFPQIYANAMNSPLSINGPDIAVGASLNEWTEGSTIFKRNGLYYITYTGNHVFSRGYRVAYGVSTSPTGPYTPGKNNPIVLNTEGSFYGLGHSGSCIGPDLDTWYIAYHNLLGDGGQGPLRKLNLDPHGFNGSKMVVYGPTNWVQPNPTLPDFHDRFQRNDIGTTWRNIGGGNWGIFNQQLMWQDLTGTSQWYSQVSQSVSNADFTAEFNLKEFGRGGNDARMGVLFCYTDESNYGKAVLSSFDNKLEIEWKTNGVQREFTSINMPGGWNYQKWQCIRIEKNGNECRVYINGMLKHAGSVYGLLGGNVGYTCKNDHADFGYIAFSNQVDGSGIFNFYKPIPGTIEAVHFNKGANGAAYNDLSAGNTGGAYRNSDVDIRANPDGGYNIGWNATGEWYNYNVNIRNAGLYHIGLRYATPTPNTKVRIWCDQTDISGIQTLPFTGGWDNWNTFMIPLKSLPAGNHTIKIETVAGEFDFYTIRFNAAANITEINEAFNNSFSGAWNYSDGNWSVQNNQAVLSGWGKRAIGNAGWMDYCVETSIQCPSTGNAGLIFRVQNPANGLANNDSRLGTDFYQGYYVGVQPGGVQLGKQNYNWSELHFQNQSLQAGRWYTLKVVAKGNLISVYLENLIIPLFQYTDDNPILSGKAGYRGFNTQVAFDNFKITDCSATMPVDWISFDAHLLKPSTVLLQWLTSNEFNNKGFEIYRSSDGISYDSVGFVSANNSTSSIQSYQWKDVDLEISSHVYYKLKQVDNDGKFSWSEIKAIQLAEQKVFAYPNPFQNKIQLTYAAEYINIELYTIDGMLLYKENNFTAHEFSPDIPSGMYLLKLFNDTDFFAQPFIKQ